MRGSTTNCGTYPDGNNRIARNPTLRRLHYSKRTEEAYLHWIRKLIRYHKKRHPREMGAIEITGFLNYLAVERRTAASTQNQALCAIVAEIYYGSGLRLMECVSLRIKDIDLERRQIMVRRGKGDNDRAALLPVRTRDRLQAQIEQTRTRHQAELAAGRGEVDLPYALRRKMPEAAKSFAWQSLFPASRPCLDPATGRVVLHHLHETAYTHIVDRGPLGVVSPLDR